MHLLICIFKPGVRHEMEREGASIGVHVEAAQQERLHVCAHERISSH